MRRAEGVINDDYERNSDTWRQPSEHPSRRQQRNLGGLSSLIRSAEAEAEGADVDVDTITVNRWGKVLDTGEAADRLRQ